jgi:nicotinamide-nucleotide amidase
MKLQYSRTVEIARVLVDELASRDVKVALAESCTAGMASAMLGTVPGISSVLCGAAVTYREKTKSDWLNISPDLISECTAESEEVTIEMAKNVLRLTSEADLSAAITGHLGPGVEADVDGWVYVAIVSRASSKISTSKNHLTATDREARQLEAAGILLDRMVEFMRGEL